MLVQTATLKNNNSKQKYKASVLVLILLTLQFGGLILSTDQAIAATVSNDNYQIDIDQFDVAPEEQKKLPTPTPQPVQNGNFGIATLPYEFSFGISDPFLDFGTLTATNPVIRTTMITITSPGTGYQVFTYQDHTLLSRKNAIIPDTTCDNGACTENTASLWQNNLTYGFGFRCDDTHEQACAKGFEEHNSFKQISDRGKKEIPQVIMRSESPVKDQQAKLSYRVNVSGTQAKEAYLNTITYIAVPNF